MTYDLNVYGRVALTRRDLVKLTSSVGMHARRERGWGAKGVTVSDASNRLAFTVDGAMRVESEDLPQDTPGVAGSTVLYNVHVPYAVTESAGVFQAVPDAAHLSSARAYANELANRVDGSVVDPQFAGVPNVKPAGDLEVKAERLYLHLDWYRPRDESPESQAFAADYLRAARATFPLAVPVRFGPHEPLQGRLPRDGDAAFDLMYRSECRLSELVITGEDISSGSISPWSSITRSDYQTASVVFELSTIERSGALGKIEDFIVEMAQYSGSFFAFAELNGSRFTTARTRGFDGAWGGLPSDPQWITWYDSQYAEIVRPHLTAGSTEEFAGGILHRWSDLPTRAEEIRRILGRDSWVPADLRGVVEATPNGPRGRVPARVMPASLRTVT